MKKSATLIIILILAVLMPLSAWSDTPRRTGRSKSGSPSRIERSSPSRSATKSTYAGQSNSSKPEAAEAAPTQPLMSKTITQALRSGHILLNFENIDIRVLARMMSELTGKNLVVDDAVNGKVTILSSREVTVDEAWNIFKAALTRYGYTAADRGDFVQIMPIAASRNKSSVVSPDRTSRTSSDMVMAILIMKNGNPDNMDKAIRPLLSEDGVLSPYKDGQALLIVDQSAVVSRISQIVKGLDKLEPSLNSTVVFPKYMEAEKVVAAIKPLYRDKESKNEFGIAAFGPSNGVIIMGGPKDLSDVKRILQRLDVPMAAPTKTEPARFFVYHLQFAQAEDVAKILSEMLSERQKAVEQRLKEAKVPATDSKNASNDDKTKFKSATDDITGPTGAADKPATVGFTSSKVSADTETNSLILYVSPSEYDDLRAVISKLDAERHQVQIAAVVAEVSLKRSKDMGVNWQAITSGGIIGSYKGGLTEEGLLNVLAGGNFVLGTASNKTKTISISNQNVEVPEFFAMLSALQENTDFNLISAPRVLTQDNKKATINVGQVVPFATGGKLDAYGQPMVTFDYREVGIKLEVTPHLSRSGKIRMDVNQEIQEVTDYLNQEMAGVKFSAPVVSNRSVNTTVTIPDGSTLLIGGLISKRTSDTIKGVPILKNLPLIGWLFRDKSTDEEKASIFISLTPKVISLESEKVEQFDAPLTPYLEHLGDPGDQQNSNRDTILPVDHTAPVIESASFSEEIINPDNTTEPVVPQHTKPIDQTEAAQ